MEYDREKVARMFDQADDVMDFRGGGEVCSDESIPVLAGKIAVERLELTRGDILLDVGTGTGDKAIPAAKICKQVIGIDIAKDCLRRAKKKVTDEGLDNIVFGFGAFEELQAEIDLTKYDINKVLAFYAMHHLPDEMKSKSIRELVRLLHCPGRIVIGDLMFFDNPEKHQDEFDNVHYDGGDVDFPAKAGFLVECMERLGAKVQVEKIHPLVGVITADFH